MTTWLARLAPYLLIAILAGVAWLQHGQVSALDETVASYKDSLEHARADLKNVVDATASNARGLAALQSTQNSFRASLSQREADIGALQRENKEIRAWADGLLPHDIAGMRAHPALTGADAYAEFLSGRDAVRAPGDGADQQWGSKPGH